MDYKLAIIDALDMLRKHEIIDKQPYKAKAYMKVIEQLRGIQSITCYEDIAHIKGVGEKIREKIKEIIATGKLEAVERIKENGHEDIHSMFQNIYGVGPVKASELIKAGIHSISELREHVQHNPKLLNDKQMIGLQYYEQLLERIPREEMDMHYSLLKQSIPEDMKEYTMEMVGSYRRGAKTSGDIDIICRVPPNTRNTKEQIVKYVQKMVKMKYICNVLAIGDHKCMAICQLNAQAQARRLDILFAPHAEYPYSLLYFTGSNIFNIEMRKMALKSGYSLNEHGLTPLSSDVLIAPYMETESDIFAFLELAFVEPYQREIYAKK
jgi:DNA polymerase beta